jgi:outer membrane lipoprotein
MQRILILIGTLLTGLLSSCATTPDFNLNNVVKDVPPLQAEEHFNQYRGTKVLWGGVIINSTNTKDGTQFEIVAYPLNSHMKPQTDENTQGRFIAEYGHYLETTEYSPGRRVTVVGELTKTQQGKIGETVYTYPVVHIEQLFLWPTAAERPNTSVHFGVGVIFH